MISDERLQQAITYLAETDSHAAELKTDVERMHWKMKAVKASIFQHSDGPVDARKAQAEVSEEAQAALREYLDALQLSDSVANKRKTEALITELWRTEQANRRAGGI